MGDVVRRGEERKEAIAEAAFQRTWTTAGSAVAQDDYK